VDADLLDLVDVEAKDLLVGRRPVEVPVGTAMKPSSETPIE